MQKHKRNYSYLFSSLTRNTQGDVKTMFQRIAKTFENMHSIKHSLDSLGTFTALFIAFCLGVDYKISAHFAAV